MKNKYCYFVSYNFGDEKCNGFGHCVIRAKNKFKTFDELTELAESIKKDIKTNEKIDVDKVKVVILNYKLMGRD